jgi:uncharacterized protein
VLILLPPSEGKASPRRGKSLDLATLSSPELTPARRAVLDALVALCQDRPAQDAAAVLGLGPTQIGEVERNAALYDAATARADHIYTGVLYDALHLADLDAAARRRATRMLLITSSVFGMVRPGDRIPSYRLAGGVSLPGLGPVAGHWRSQLPETMHQLVGKGLVVDLRSSTYAAFWRPAKEFADRVVSMRVLHEQDGRRSVVSHFNKATKGRLVRSLLGSGDSPSRVGGFVELLADLGWTVEREGNRLDVIVTKV